MLGTKIPSYQLDLSIPKQPWLERLQLIIQYIYELSPQVNDPRLRHRLATELANAAKQKKFGLVFKDRLPELLPASSPATKLKLASRGHQHSSGFQPSH